MPSDLSVEPERATAQSFDDFVRDHQTALVRYAVLLCGSRALGEDLVQDVLVRLYPRWDGLREPAPYVRRCVTNEFLSWRRRWSTRHIRVVPDEVLHARPAESALDDGPDPDLWARLQALPRQQRAAVVLRFYEGYNDDAIAEILDCKPGTVRAHVSRGLAALRTALDEMPEGGR